MLPLVGAKFQTLRPEERVRFSIPHTGRFMCLTLCFSLLTEADAGHTEFMDEVFQNETRFPGGEWKAASEPFTDVVSAARWHANNVRGGFKHQTHKHGWDFMSFLDFVGSFSPLLFPLGFHLDAYDRRVICNLF